MFIEPGSPWENGYIESFDGKLRDELLNREIFDTLLEAKVLIERWRWEYNHVRPHSSLGYRPPASEAKQAWPSGSAAPRQACMRGTNMTTGTKAGDKSEVKRRSLYFYKQTPDEPAGPAPQDGGAGSDDETAAPGAWPVRRTR